MSLIRPKPSRHICVTSPYVSNSVCSNANYQFPPPNSMRASTVDRPESGKQAGKLRLLTSPHTLSPWPSLMTETQLHSGFRKKKPKGLYVLLTSNGSRNRAHWSRRFQYFQQISSVTVEKIDKHEVAFLFRYLTFHIRFFDLGSSTYGIDIH